MLPHILDIVDRALHLKLNRKDFPCVIFKKAHRRTPKLSPVDSIIWMQEIEGFTPHLFPSFLLKFPPSF